MVARSRTSWNHFHGFIERERERERQRESRKPDLAEQLMPNPRRSPLIGSPPPFDGPRRSTAQLHLHEPCGLEAKTNW